jgi:Ca-activated chloride channel family protein
LRWLANLWLFLAFAVLPACSRKSNAAPTTATADEAEPAPSAATTASQAAPAEKPPLELDVIFSSEKKDWAQEALGQFQATGPRTDDGRPIRVKVAYTGSIEPIDGIVQGTLRPHVFSPASSLVLPLLQDEWTGASGGSAKPIVGASDPLVLSPVVVAMWEPMARALGWPAKKVGWHEIADLARSSTGWRGEGHPEWGDFRFGHTHPGYSNSGLIAVLAEVYAALGKTRDLTAADVSSNTARAFLRDIEGSVIHYGRSTGFFYDVLTSHGPSYLSAAVVYENLVVSSTDTASLPFPLVCLYPREGTEWADHPYAVLDAPWVGDAERDAAAKLKAFLLSRPVQERAMTRFGFRPALTDIPLGAPIDAAHGADPKEPQTLLAAPGVRIERSLLDTWNDNKRGVDVVVVFDRSGSMAGARLKGAREGLLGFLGKLRPDDRAVLLSFNEHIDPPAPPGPPASLTPRVQNIFADGQTALYDAILRARDLADASALTDKKRIHAVVVLTDGEDNKSQNRLDDLLAKLTTAEQGGGIRVFTIGYGGEASGEALKRIARQTGGAYYHGDVDDIRAVYEEIASFF